MLEPIIQKNDRLARIVIIITSIIVFGAIVTLGRVEVPVGGAFDVHVFAKINAVINTIVSLLLIAGFGIYNIMNMVIISKMKDIAILKAEGFARKDIVQIFLSQSLIIGLVGATTPTRRSRPTPRR